MGRFNLYDDATAQMGIIFLAQNRRAAYSVIKERAASRVRSCHL